MSRFCTKCGSELKIDGGFCGGCGAAVVASSGNVPLVLIRKGVSTGWQKTFDLIERAAGREVGWFVPYLIYGKLTFFERRRVISAWAVIFGPFYYLAKGMWRQAFSFTAIFIFVTVAINYAFGITGRGGSPNPKELEGIAFAGFLSQRAKFDYYRKCVLGYHGWW